LSGGRWWAALVPTSLLGWALGRFGNVREICFSVLCVSHAKTQRRCTRVKRLDLAYIAKLG
jgi:hypothetical protein